MTYKQYLTLFKTGIYLVCVVYPYLSFGIEKIDINLRISTDSGTASTFDFIPIYAEFSLASDSPSSVVIRLDELPGRVYVAKINEKENMVKTIRKASSVTRKTIITPGNRYLYSYAIYWNYFNDEFIFSSPGVYNIYMIYDHVEQSTNMIKKTEYLSNKLEIVINPNPSTNIYEYLTNNRRLIYFINDAFNEVGKMRLSQELLNCAYGQHPSICQDVEAFISNYSDARIANIATLQYLSLMPNETKGEFLKKHGDEIYNYLSIAPECLQTDSISSIFNYKLHQLSRAKSNEEYNSTLNSIREEAKRFQDNYNFDFTQFGLNQKINEIKTLFN